ncbi:unnamed protein product [Gordionus sp. m RMFG-2023]
MEAWVCYICRATDHVRNQWPRRRDDERTTNRRPAPESQGQTERERSRSRENPLSIHTTLPVRITQRTPENGVLENNGMTIPLVEPWNIMNRMSVAIATIAGQ